MNQDLQTVHMMQGKEYGQLVANGPGKDAKKALDKVTAVCKDVLAVEHSMLQAVSSALSLKPETRAGFANLALQELDKTIKFYLSDTQQKIANHPQKLAQAEHNLQNATERVSTNETELKATKQDVATVQSTISQNKEDITEHNKLVKQHPKNVQKGQEETDKAEDRATGWTEVIESFIFLKLYNSGKGRAMSTGSPDVDMESEDDF